MKIFTYSLIILLSIFNSNAMEKKIFSHSEEQQLRDAVDINDGDAVRALLHKGMSPTIEVMDGTLIHLAVRCNVKLKALKSLLAGLHGNEKEGVNLYSDPRFLGGGLTALHMAAKDGDYEHCFAMEMLLEAGADINKQAIGETTKGDTPLHLAVIDSKQQAIDMLLKHKVRVNVCEMNGQTPMHYAALAQSTCSIKKLAAAGALVNVRDASGNTPLHIAVRIAGTEKKAIATVEELLAQGAHVNALTDAGHSPWMMAKDRNNYALLYLLEKAGAKKVGN